MGRALSLARSISSILLNDTRRCLIMTSIRQRNTHMAQDAFVKSLMDTGSDLAIITTSDPVIRLLLQRFLHSLMLIGNFRKVPIRQSKNFPFTVFHGHLITMNDSTLCVTDTLMDLSATREKA